jgi:hypothetical protein
MIYPFAKFFSWLETINSSSKSYRFYCLLSLLFFFVIILIRNPIFINEPRFWAEEQSYFETFFHMGSWWEGFDVLIYPTHYIALLRVSGLLATIPGLESAPIVTTAFGFFILIIPLLILFLTNCKYWDTLQKKIVLSLFLVFSCSTGEIWLTSTNVQTLIPVSSFLILLDTNLVSKLKRFLYSIIIACAVVTGPTTLFMAPFFLLRYLQSKHKQFLSYCAILFFLGSLHLVYFFVARHAGLTFEGRFAAEFDPIKSFIYITSPNVIFPLFGYFVSIIYRTGFDIIHAGLENTPYLGLIAKFFPGFLATRIESICNLLTDIKGLIFSACFIIFTLIIYYEFRRTSIEGRIYFLSLYLYLGFLLGLLSLGGLSGFRYTYLTSFILLFYLYQGLVFEKEKIKRGLIKFLLVFSVVVGIFEYYPRTISYTPDNLFGEGVSWPVWSEEVSEWKKDSNHLPRVWPYIKKTNGIWPSRKRVFIVNLNEPEYWEKYGEKKKFSEEVLKIFSSK